MKKLLVLILLSASSAWGMGKDTWQSANDVVHNGTQKIMLFLKQQKIAVERKLHNRRLDNQLDRLGRLWETTCAPLSESFSSPERSFTFRCRKLEREMDNLLKKRYPDK